MPAVATALDLSAVDSSIDKDKNYHIIIIYYLAIYYLFLLALYF